MPYGLGYEEVLTYLIKILKKCTKICKNPGTIYFSGFNSGLIISPVKGFDIENFSFAFSLKMESTKSVEKLFPKRKPKFIPETLSF